LDHHDIQSLDEGDTQSLNEGHDTQPLDEGDTQSLNEGHDTQPLDEGDTQSLNEGHDTQPLDEGDTQPLDECHDTQPLDHEIEDKAKKDFEERFVESTEEDINNLIEHGFEDKLEYGVEPDDERHDNQLLEERYDTQSLVEGHDTQPLDEGDTQSLNEGHDTQPLDEFHDTQPLDHEIEDKAKKDFEERFVESTEEDMNNLIEHGFEDKIEYGVEPDDERHDNQLLEERYDTQSLDEGDTQSLNECHDTQSLDERHDSQSLDERHDTQLLEERHDTQLLEERHDTQSLEFFGIGSQLSDTMDFDGRLGMAEWPTPMSYNNDGAPNMAQGNYLEYPGPWNASFNTSQSQQFPTTWPMANSVSGLQLPPHQITRFEIPGYWDVALRGYTEWQQSETSNELYKAEIQKAYDVLSENGFDLAQIYNGENALRLLEDEGMMVGVARRFTGEVPLWVQFSCTLIPGESI
jgi:hypothetical protein